MKSNLILEAFSFMVVAHGDQTRDYTGDPYSFHPARVGSRVMMLPGADEEVGAAAILHDVVEDTPFTASELEARFGRRTAGLVYEVTNQFTKKQHPSLRREERKRLEVERLSGVSEWAKTIKLVDRIDNLCELDPASDFCATYAAESRLLLEAIDHGLFGLGLEMNALIAACESDHERAKAGMTPEEARFQRAARRARAKASAKAAQDE